MSTDDVALPHINLITQYRYCALHLNTVVVIITHINCYQPLILFSLCSLGCIYFEDKMALYLILYINSSVF